MNTFQIIFFKLIDISKLDNSNFLIFNFYFSLKLIKNLSVKNKYNFLKKYIINNKLLSESLKEQLFYLFYKSQKFYFNLNNLVFKYRCKKALYYNNNYDINYNLLTSLNKKILTTIYDKENNLNYIFRISDLINIINNSLCYMENFNFSVIDIKNPYTNLPFSISNLYNIYFTIKNSTFLMPQFFHLYFLDDFNKENFYKINESLIKTYTLNKYVKNLNKFEKILIIKEMLNEFKNGIYIIYNKEIINNDNLLINTFEDCIKDYIFLNYSSNLLLVFEAKENLKNKFVLISSKNILSQLNINININNLSLFIENYIRQTITPINNDISLNNIILSNNENNENNGENVDNLDSINNINTQINTQINTNNILRNRLNNRYIHILINKLKKKINYTILNKYPIIINIFSIKLFLFRLYISYKFIIYIYNEIYLIFKN